MTQEIIFTTLPNHFIEVEGKKHLLLSVYITPHIKSDTKAKLSDAPDFLNWPEIIKNTTYKFRLANHKDDITAKLFSEQIDVDLYKNIFHPNIQIEEFESENLDKKQIISFPAKHIEGFLIEQIKLTAINSPKTLLQITDFINPQQLGSISNISIDTQVRDMTVNSNINQELTLRPFIWKDDALQNTIRTLRKNSRFIEFNKNPEPRKDFLQFLDFHKSDLKANLNRTTIKKPEFEFHNILSVITSFPYLMRKLGFIIDLAIPYVNSIPNSGNIRVIPENLKFNSSTTKLSAPLTGYNITANGFFIADKKDSSLKNGFVRINTPEFTIVQIDTDGLALRTSQAVDNKANEARHYFEKKYSAVNKTNKMSQMIKFNPQIIQKRSLLNAIDQNISDSKQPSLSYQKMRPIMRMKLVEPPREEGLNIVRSAGIGLIQNGASKELANRITKNNQFQKMLMDNSRTDTKISTLRIPEEVLYSDDLTSGFRMDIAYEDNPTKWYSLHQRQMSYSWFDNSGVEHKIEKPDKDEGYVELAVVEKEGSSDSLYVGETLARWEGWSLSVGRPGLAINDSEENPEPNPEKRNDFLYKNRAQELKKYSFNPTIDFRVNAQSDIVPGTLPKLRFGQSYRVRVRAVDLAGNSIPLNSESENPNETYKSNVSYLRYEPLSSPITLVGNELRDGEFLEQMIIRSNWDTTVEKYEKKYSVPNQDSKGLSVRYLLPPKNSQLVAETHGCFEKAFSNPQHAKEIYNIITSHDGLYQQGANNKEKIYSEKDAKIIYLPDPMAAGIAIFIDSESEGTHSTDFEPRMFSYFSKDEIKPNNTNSISIPEDWYNAQALIFKLEEGKSIGANWNSKNRTITVTLPKGERAKLKISSFWREEDLERVSAIWKIIQMNAGSKRNEIEKIALSGQHWMISPFRTFELIHAVQQPIKEPILRKIYAEREYGDNFALINLSFEVDGKSSDEAILHAEWTEDVDDGISVDIGKETFNESIPDIDLFYLDETVTIGNIPEVRPDLVINKERIYSPIWQVNPKEINMFQIQPGSSKINYLYQLQANKMVEIESTKKSSINLDMLSSLKLDIQEFKLNLIKQLDIRNYPLEHFFGNTRHRWVDYSVMAHSRYSAHFSSIDKGKEKLQFTRQSKPQRINILSSARPAKPEIDYIIPILEWEKNKAGSVMTQKRLGGGLRIYLKRPWFSSGDDEKLAVIIPNDSNDSYLNFMYKPNGYTDILTHWGSDPLFVSEAPRNYSPRSSDFRNQIQIVKNLSYPDLEKASATAIVYNPLFDREKQMWFADISLNTSNMYFPFIKLALARYQEHSLKSENYDICLSPIEMSTMVQLVPPRTASVELIKNAGNVKINVKLSGPVYNQSKSVSSNRIKISIVDTDLNQPVQGYLINNFKLLANLQGNAGIINEQDGWSFSVGRYMKGDNYFDFNNTIEIPSEYTSKAFQVIIEEIEMGQTSINDLPEKYSERVKEINETSRITYIDVFEINK